MQYDTPLELTGQWNNGIDRITEFLDQIDQKFQNTVGSWPDSNRTRAIVSLYNNVSAVARTIVLLCKQKPASAQAVAILMRALVEACAAIFAFSKDNKVLGHKYITYSEVIKYKWLLARERNRGCPIDPAARAMEAILRKRKATTKAILHRDAAQFLNPERVGKKSPADVLMKALVQDDPRVFTMNWYGETPKRVFSREEGLEWVGDLLYTMLCSAVHSDVWAEKAFGGSKCSTPAMIAVQLRAIAVCRLCEVLGISIGSDRKGFLRKYCWKPLAKKS